MRAKSERLLAHPKFQTVVSEMKSRRKLLLSSCMGDVVAEMHKIGRTWSNRPGGFHSLFKIHMGWMRHVAQGIKNEHLGTARGFHCCRRNRGTIGEIGQKLTPSAMKDIASGLHLAMREIDRADMRVTEIKGTTDDMGIEPEIILPGLGIVKGITKSIAQLFH